MTNSNSNWSLTIQILNKRFTKLEIKLSFMLFFLISFSLSRATQKTDTPIPLAPEGTHVHFQSFADPEWDENYFPSTFPNYDGEWKIQRSNIPPNEKMIFAQNPNSRYALSTLFESPLILRDDTFVLQYEVRFQESLKCGAATMKVYGKNFDPNLVPPNLPYVLLFGPNRCGATDEVQFIFRFKNRTTGQYVAHTMTDCPKVPNDKFNHLYTLIIRPDNSFRILIDSFIAKEGNLLDSKDFVPPVNPPKMIDDVTDTKPADWVEDEMYPDPKARKPSDWDENEPEFIPDPKRINPPKNWINEEFIPDPNSKKPDNWDDEFYGEWEPSQIPNPKCEYAPCGKYYPPAIRNPKYKGKWSAPLIKNPAYKGQWKPRQIPNPNYYSEDNVHNLETIYGLGFEFFTQSKGIGFNNVLVSTNEAAVMNWNRLYFYPKRRLQGTIMKDFGPSEGKLENAPVHIKNHDIEKLAAKFNTQVNQQPEPIERQYSNNQYENFSFALIEAWTIIYDANPLMSMITVFVFFAFPIIISTFSVCCLGRKGRRSRGSKSKEKDEDYDYSDYSYEEITITPPPPNPDDPRKRK